MTLWTPNRRDIIRVGAAGTAGLMTHSLFTEDAEAAEHTLKFASLAPPGSLWYKAFEKAAREIKEATSGSVSFKLYGGGVMGDERAMVRKMRTGQLDVAAVTSVGLGDINKQLLVLQLPLTFKSYGDLDRVRNKMSKTLTGLLESAGFVLLGWGDVGFIYLFSNSAVATPSDAKNTKMWVWDADPITKEVAKVAGINATPLGVPDVLPSLSTGVIDAYLNSPYGATALQWHTKAKFVTDLKLAVTIGGTVLNKSTWDKLDAKQQEAVKTISAKHHKALLGQIRKANSSAQKQLVTKHGYTAVKAQDFGAWKKLADNVRGNLTGKLFKPAIVNEMMGAL